MTSLTASGAPKRSRSTPATETLRACKRPTISEASSRRLRTSTIISPAFAGRFVPFSRMKGSVFNQRSTCRAIRSASLRSWRASQPCSLASLSPGDCSRSSSACCVRTGSHKVTSPARSSPLCLVASTDRPKASDPISAIARSTKSSTGCAVRKLRARSSS